MSLNPLTQDIEQTTLNRALTKEQIDYVDPLLLRGDIKLGNFTFNTIDEDGIVWVIQDIEGWWGPPDVELPDYPRGNADGSFDVRGRWAARQLTLTGTMLPPDRSYVPLARQRLVDAANLVYEGNWLRVEESNYTKVSWVRLTERPKIETVTARGRTEFQIGLKAPDPIKYSWNELDPENGLSFVPLNALNNSTGSIGSTTIENIGNTPVPVNIQVSGPLTNNALLQNATTGGLILFTKTLESDDVLTIDTFYNSVQINGDYIGGRSYIDPLADFFKLDIGFNIIDLIDSGEENSTASAGIRYRSGWIG